MTTAWTRGPWRWAFAVGVALALVLHLVLWQGLQAVWAPFGAGAPPMRKMAAAYTRALTLAEAPAVRSVPLAASARRGRPAEKAPALTATAASAASAAVADDPPEAPATAASQAPASVAEGTAEPASAALADRSAPTQAASAAASAATAAGSAVAEAVASSPAPALTASAASASSTPEATAFEWPRATRIRYRLLGQYRGEVHGHASVEWLREGERYQVHLDVSAGGVFRRVMSSEGRITPAGLVPERYVQRTELLFNFVSPPKTEEMRFGGPTIRLMNGQEVPSLPMMQDTASQFIQFIYLLSTRPGLQQAGHSVELALALPRSVRLWRYETGPTVDVPTPAGPVPTLHLRPASGAPPGDWTVEIWFAPRLQMLPVRFRIQQNAELYFDLFIDQLPEQAGGR